MSSAPPRPPLEPSSKAIHRNIKTVMELEETLLRERSRADRAADAIASFTGSLKFLASHVLFYGLWITVNLGWIPGPRFDPYPFMLLSTVVSLEAIFLSTFVLIKQNRMSRREDLRGHLDLQINVVAEREMTLVLQMLQQISARLGVRVAGEEIRELTEETPVDALASELLDKLPEQ